MEKVRPWCGQLGSRTAKEQEQEQLRTKADWSVWDDDDYTAPPCAHAAQNVSTSDMK